LSLRWKTYLIVGVTLIAAVAAIFVVSQTVLMRGFTKVETAEVQEEVARAKAALNRELKELSATTFGYASWDDTVAFLEGRNQAYPETNLSDSFFTGSGVNLVVMGRNDGTVALGRGFDLRTAKTTSLPVGLSEYLGTESPLLWHGNVDSRLSGLVMLPEGPMLIDSQPILTSKGEGPVRGALIMGRWLDAAQIAELESETRLSLGFLPLSAEELPAEVGQTAAAGDRPAEAFVAPFGSGAVAGYSLLEDVFGEPVGVLRVDIPRVVYEEGSRSVLYFMFALIGVVVVFGLAANRLLERSLFRRLAQLTAQVRHVKSGQGDLAPLAVGGKDELAVLARTIDSTLSQLESTRNQQETQARSLSGTLEELQGRHRDLEKAHRHLQHLQEASVTLGGSLEITDALAQLELVALDVFEADEVWLLRLHSDERQLQGLRAFCRQTPGYATLPGLFGCEQADGALDQEANGLLRAVFSGSPALFIESVSDLASSEQERLFGRAQPDLGGFRSLALVPLYADSQPVGLIISASFRPSAFSADKRSTIMLFAGQVAQALKNTRLYEEIKALGEIDSLSGLYNRRRSLEQLEMEVGRARRYQGTFSILIADVDNFKLFNDTYGHPVGDEIIKKVAGLLEHRSRASDFVGRFGGDEFILILPETYRAGARTLADHLRAALNSLPYMAPDGASIPLRMSFGAASFPEDGQDAASLIAIADANLYESKRWGGDTVTVRSESIGGEAVDAQAFSTLDSLVSAVDNKDHYTRRHSAQVAEQTAAVARALGLSKEQQEMLRVAALLHDVGKIGVPDRILRKPGALTLDEIEFMNQHSLIGSMMIAQHLPDLIEVREAVVSHHERWDGTGYPARLRGTEIPAFGRILGVADAYSAMTTDRPYRAALDAREALAELVKGSGTQFDPEIVRVFVSCLSGGAGSSPLPSTAGQPRAN
jgi:diguanylate cyclase (GGDEF)-like protein/putative nucleotidyltransferase with HDIG domain